MGITYRSDGIILVDAYRRCPRAYYLLVFSIAKVGKQRILDIIIGLFYHAKDPFNSIHRLLHVLLIRAYMYSLSLYCCYHHPSVRAG